MNHFVNENIVMQFYLEQMEQDNIIFLKKRAYAKEQIAQCINQLISETKMNNKIQIATKLWKLLFDSAMSYIEPDKQGYDKIFNYFDAYVEFEELIFASDSFYRDHTLHCIWVYFLGEYLKRKEEFHDLFLEESSQMDFINSLLEVFDYANIMDSKNYKRLKDSLELSQKVIELNEAVRCISALTHDLECAKHKKLHRKRNMFPMQLFYLQLFYLIENCGNVNHFIAAEQSLFNYSYKSL